MKLQGVIENLQETHASPPIEIDKPQEIITEPEIIINEPLSLGDIQTPVTKLPNEILPSGSSESLSHKIDSSVVKIKSAKVKNNKNPEKKVRQSKEIDHSKTLPTALKHVSERAPKTSGRTTRSTTKAAEKASLDKQKASVSSIERDHKNDKLALDNSNLQPLPSPSLQQKVTIEQEILKRKRIVDDEDHDLPRTKMLKAMLAMLEKLEPGHSVNESQSSFSDEITDVAFVVKRRCSHLC